MQHCLEEGSFYYSVYTQIYLNIQLKSETSPSLSLEGQSPINKTVLTEYYSLIRTNTVYASEIKFEELYVALFA